MATDTPASTTRCCTIQEPTMQTVVLTLTLFAALFGFFVLATAVTFSSDDGRKASHSAEHLPDADGVTLVIVGFRHGQRNPTQFLKNDTTHEKWAWEGLSQLTTIGKRQAYSLGKFLRTRYDHLIDRAFFPAEVKAYSSSAERCQQTLQSVMAGFFEPKGRSMWNDNLAWQPVPYEINDPLLRMYNVKCPHYDEVYNGIRDDNIPAAADWLRREKNLTDYIAKHSGLNASLSDLADVADNLFSMKLRNAPLPNWVTKPTLPGYPPKDMYKQIMKFAEAHQIMCADDLPCARIMSGLWLNQILETLKSKAAGKLNARHGIFYAAHTETVLSLIRLLKAEGVEETPTSAGFIIEMTDRPEPAVRFIFHEADPENPDKRLAEIKRLHYCKRNQWCPLEQFVKHVQAHAFGDWNTACHLPKCPV